MRKISIVVLMSFSILLANCGVKVSYPSNFPMQIMISQKDMPKYWFRSDGEDFDVDGAIAAHTLGFELRPQKMARFMSQQIIIYKDMEAAKKAYPVWAEEYFPTNDWKQPDGLIFKPKDKDDYFDFRCIDGEAKINNVSQGKYLTCTSLQQHDQFVSLILVNIDGETLTLDQFKDILAKSDEHLYNDISQGPVVQ